MRMSRAALYGAVALLTTFAVACTQVIDGADPRIAISNGRLLIEGKPFSGLLKQAIGDNYEIRQTPYRDGLEHGGTPLFRDIHRELANDLDYSPVWHHAYRHMVIDSRSPSPADVHQHSVVLRILHET